MTMRTGLWAAIAVLVLLAGGIWTWQMGNTRGEEVAHGAVLGAPFILTDQNGDEITEAALRGHPTAIFFGFTHCPEVCPTTLSDMAGYVETLGSEADDLRVFFVSVDPERDTPGVLKDYVGIFSDRFTGITGDPEAVGKMIEDWHIYAARVPVGEGDYTMDHTASVFLLRPDGSLQSTISYGEAPDVAVDKLRRLIDEA